MGRKSNLVAYVTQRIGIWNFFLTNRLELVRRTGKIFTAGLYYHGNTSVLCVKHKLVMSRVKMDGLWMILARFCHM